MSFERTEPATPKRRSDARNKGQIPKSADFNSAVMLAIGTYLIAIFSPGIMTKFKSVTIEVFTNLNPSRVSMENFHGYLMPYVYVTMSILLPILITLMVCGIILNYLQIGYLFTLEPIMPNFSKLSPMSMLNGLKKIFIINPRSLVELAKSFAKMLIVAGVAYFSIMSSKQDILTLLGADVELALGRVSGIIFKMITQIIIILIFLGIIDKKYQHYEFEKSMKMSKEEIKDEFKNSEGDPKIKSKIKSVQMQFAMQRMSSAVPKADVVITNPTHYAVALKYDTSVAPAPQVVAKGVDFVAFKIKEIAKHNGVPIVENKPLARTLYKVVPLDGLIPAELYVAVAEVLAYVYRTGKNRVK